MNGPLLTLIAIVLLFTLVIAHFIAIRAKSWRIEHKVEWRFHLSLEEAVWYNKHHKQWMKFYFISEVACGQYAVYWVYRDLLRKDTNEVRLSSIVPLEKAKKEYIKTIEKHILGDYHSDIESSRHGRPYERRVI